MKDYLQLDGVAYKLVPIQTPVNPRNPYEMGRIDTDKMYSIVKTGIGGIWEIPIFITTLKPEKFHNL